MFKSWNFLYFLMEPNVDWSIENSPFESYYFFIEILRLDQKSKGKLA